MFEFLYTLTEQDYLTFNEYHIEYSPAFKKSRVILRFLPPVFFLLLVVMTYITSQDSMLLYIMGGMALIASVLWIILYKNIMKKNVKKQIRRLAKTGKLPFNRQVNMRFEETSFVEASSDVASRINYSKIERILAGRYVIIYINSMQAHILPGHIFQNREHQDAFLSFLQTKTQAPLVFIPN